MKTKVKICGIRTLDNAEDSIKAGADFLGFNFISHSKRYIKPVDAKEIIAQIKNKVMIIGVFQNQTIDEVNSIANLVGLDYVQLHGNEDNKYMDRIEKPIIKTIFTYPVPNDKIRYFLLDRIKQGEGEMVALEKAEEIANIFPIFFAGGLSPENVAFIVSSVKPFAVDVAGGIESNSVIDTKKVLQFITNAKGVII